MNVEQTLQLKRFMDEKHKTDDPKRSYITSFSHGVYYSFPKELVWKTLRVRQEEFEGANIGIDAPLSLEASRELKNK